MGAGEHAWITGWGFGLQHSGTQPNCTLRVDQVEEGSHASLAGLRVDDEIVSINREPSSSLSLSEAIALIKGSTDGLQLVVKRCCFQGGFQTVSTTLRIPAPYRPQGPKELCISDSQDEAFYGQTCSEAESPRQTPTVRTQVCIPAPKDRIGANTKSSGGGGTRLEIPPGSVVELQLSLSKTTLEDKGYTSLGSALGVEGDFCHKKNNEDDDTTTSPPGCTLYIPLHERQPLSQRGVLISGSSALHGQVEVTTQPLGRGPRRERVGSGETEAKASERGDYGEGEGGRTEKAPTEEAPTSSSVSFGIQSEEGDSESERELNKPNKHRPRHARLRRSESLSEKQVKEAKSKCKRIALLLTAAAPNPNNKGVLMFKKHRQRAKQYTLVSYGTGENEPEFEAEEDEEDNKETHAVEFTVLATSETELDEDFFTNPPGHKSIVTFDWDTGLLEIERKLHKPEDMNALPETKGKGALMFAQRRQRMDEIVAEHEDMRSKGIPVEAVQEEEKHYQQVEPRTYMPATESQNYMDVNVHQQQQYQQYQEQYYQQQQQQQYQEYQQQLQYQQQQQHYQQQQEYQQQQYQQQQEYQQRHYQEQQEYEQQQQYQQYQQQQQQMQQYSHQMNGMSSQQTNVMQSSIMNRSAKPFSVQNTEAATFSPTSQEQPCYSVGQGEQIASRDERISVPAIKTGILQDNRMRNKAKPMFTFKETPKVSPNPELLNLLNRGDKKAGFESGPEEDYLSLGAEACNFLQSPKVKHKIPPPVAPKPHINPASPPWSPQPEIASQQFPQHAENNIPATAEAPGPEADPVPEMESSAIPKQEPSPTPAAELQEAPAQPLSQEHQEALNTWGPSEQQMLPDQQQETWNENQSQQHINNAQLVQPSPQVQAKSELPVSSWAPSPTQAHQQPPVSAWGPTEVQSQTLAQTQSHMQQPTWVTQPQVQVQPPTSIQTQSQPEPPWVTQSPPQTQSQPQPQPQPKPQPQSQPQPQMNSWATAPTQSPPQPPWAQSQASVQPSVGTWPQDLNQTQAQPPWVQQQQESQPLPSWTTPQQHPQPPWAQPQSQPQHQPPWVTQTQQQALPQQPVNAWTQPQSPVQAQPPWAQQAQPPLQPSSQVQQSQGPWASVPTQSQPQPPWPQQPQEHPQQMMNSWAPEQNQVQPPWSQSQPPAQAPPPWVHQPQQEAPPPHSQSQTVVSTWGPRPQQGPVSTTAPTETQKLNQSAKPWSPPQTTQPPLQRMGSYTFGTKVPSPTPTSSTMSPSGMGSAFEMPALRGKGAELFAKRQSRMEKYVVDSDTVQANKALGRSSSLSPPVRLSPLGLSSRSTSVSPSPRPSSYATYTSCSTERQAIWSEKSRKPPTPWEAASRHPLGLVDEAFDFQDLQHCIATNLRSAAHRKLLPEPPADWKAKVAYEPPTKSQGWGTSRLSLPFLSPTKSTASAPAAPVPYGSPLRQSQPHRSITEANLGAFLVRPENKRILGQSSYKSTYSYTWRR
ncbi:synaptopodin-2-like isoform X2 [Pygocentrus nattereri]|uniref:PDZ domain-containing protein n=1 Tax=Pygocentrus nattereri TaxID=42514 RepID=A0A3B4DMA0_PYGNA|nr:synaptopodin-2-like isoform X2 [Pygocentrus nattereri]